MTPLILIIEDDEMFRSNICDFLELEEFHYISAENGLIGLNLARQFNPDLIISDIDMPILDGYGVLKHLREDVKTVKIPLIFLTGDTDKNHRYQALQLGVNDCQTKSISFSKLLAVINQQIGSVCCLNQSKT